MATRNLQTFLTSLTLLLISYSVHLFTDASTLEMLTREDGSFEMTGALLFFLSSVLFYVLYRNDTHNEKHFIFNRKKNLFYLGLSLIFLFGFLEEISWGQRIFNFSTPESLASLNEQNEFNIHNLAYFHRLENNETKSGLELLLNMDRLFSLFWFGFCFLIPFLYVINKKMKKLLNKISFPVTHIFFGFLFLTNYTLAKIVEMFASSPVQTVVEIKEFNFALLFFAVSIWLLHEKGISVNINISQTKPKVEVPSISRTSILLRQLTNIF